MFKVFFDNKTKQPWVVRIIKHGDKYAVDRSGLPELIHNGTEPLVEFYDGRFEQTEYGQFVNRFFVRVVLQRGSSEIRLDQDVRDSTIHGECMGRITKWLNKVSVEMTALPAAA